MRQQWAGRHEGPGGVKPPITMAHHQDALNKDKRGRHERTPPVFKSPFAEVGEAYVVLPDGGWFQTTRTPPRG